MGLTLLAKQYSLEDGDHVLCICQLGLWDVAQVILLLEVDHAQTSEGAECSVVDGDIIDHSFREVDARHVLDVVLSLHACFSISASILEPVFDVELLALCDCDVAMHHLLVGSCDPGFELVAGSCHHLPVVDLLRDHLGGEELDVNSVAEPRQIVDVHVVRLLIVGRQLRSGLLLIDRAHRTEGEL